MTFWDSSLARYLVGISIPGARLPHGPLLKGPLSILSRLPLEGKMDHHKRNHSVLPLYGSTLEGARYSFCHNWFLRNESAIWSSFMGRLNKLFPKVRKLKNLGLTEGTLYAILHTWPCTLLFSLSNLSYPSMKTHVGQPNSLEPL